MKLPALARLASLAALAGCGEGEKEALAHEPLVYTTFYPTTYFAERIGGGEPRVVCPLPAEADPILWEPSREVLEEYQRAELVVLNGAGFERWVEHASLAPSRVVDSAAPFRERFLVQEGVTHSHGPAGEHTHEGVDGHTWLDPHNARAQAAEIARAMSERWPARADDFARNLAALDADLRELDARFVALAPRAAAARILASHPAYDYVAARYGWSIANLDLDPAAPLDEAQLASVRAARGDVQRCVLLWEREPLPATDALLREQCGVHGVVFSPCEQLAPEERAAGRDYLDVMRANLDRFEAALARD